MVQQLINMVLERKKLYLCYSVVLDDKPEMFLGSFDLDNIDAQPNDRGVFKTSRFSTVVDTI